jgi:hypothetical protein
MTICFFIVDGVYRNLGAGFGDPCGVHGAVYPAALGDQFVICGNHKFTLGQKPVTLFDGFSLTVIFPLRETGIIISPPGVVNNHIRQHCGTHPLHRKHLCGHAPAHLSGADNPGVNRRTSFFQFL